MNSVPPKGYARSAQNGNLQMHNNFQLLKSGIGARIVIICFLIMMLTIPLGMVDGVIESRVGMFNGAVNEIAKDWGGSQKIIAPVLIVPTERTGQPTYYSLPGLVEKDLRETTSESVMILPENLHIAANIRPEMRHRGIFDVLVHTTDIKITGSFSKPDLSFLKPGTRLLWDKAVLSIGVDPSLIRGNPQMVFDSRELKLLPGSMLNGIEGISAAVCVSDGDLNKSFDLSFRFNGSNSISLAPLGQKNVFEVSSPWPHPIFTGTFRPDEPQISNDGFKAVWNIPYIARDYPQASYVNSHVHLLQNKLAAVQLYEDMPVHKQVERLSKYGIMFIMLTFVMMFLFELSLKRQMHFVQYGVIGLAISLFFLTVLSVSEYLPFGVSYALASATVLAMIALYVYSALSSRSAAIISAVLMALLYGVLYMMLSEAQYALLSGTIILLVTMAAIMWATRNLNQMAAPEESTSAVLSTLAPKPKKAHKDK